MSELPSKTYTIDQVAEMLGFSAKTIYRLCDANKLPHTRHGRVIRISDLDVKEYYRRFHRGGAHDGR